MDTLPAREFLERFINAYGQTWEALFFDIIKTPAGAKHMGEFIDDLEEHGQQEEAFIDKDGVVLEGNRIALALAVLNKDIKFTFDEFPIAHGYQFWTLEFQIESGDEKDILNNLDSYLSFRVGKDWVTPWHVEADEDGEVAVVMHCPSGEYTADRMVPIISERLRRLAGADISGVYVSATVLDDEAAE